MLSGANALHESAKRWNTAGKLRRSMFPAAFLSPSFDCVPSEKRRDSAQDDTNLSEKLPDTLHDILYLLIRQFREHRKGEAPVCELFRHGEVASLVAKILEAGLEVQRQGIMKSRRDSVCREMLLELVSSAGLNHVKMIDMLCIRHFLRQWR